MGDDGSDEAEAPREEERFDPERLRPFLEGSLPGVTPCGARIKSAHDMRREFNILSALQGAYPKAPRRFVAGHTKDRRFGGLIHPVRILARQSARATEQGRIHGLGAAPA